MQSDMWKSEPFTRGQAWIDLLMLANFKDGWFRCRGVRVEVLRGQVGHGTVALAKRWQWSRGKVKRFLNELETVQQIVQQKDNVTTCITITNYSQYQSNGTLNDTQDGQQTDSKRTANGHKQIKINNDNQSKPIKKKSENKFSDADLSFAKFMYERILIVAERTKQPNLESWANTIRLMRNIEKYSAFEMHDVFTWANNDSFWQSNIKSPNKFRKHYATLHSQMKNRGNTNEKGRTLSEVERVEAGNLEREAERQRREIIDITPH